MYACIHANPRLGKNPTVWPENNFLAGGFNPSFLACSLDHPKYRRALKSIGTTGWTTNHFLTEYLCGITVLLWTAANSFCVSQKEGFTQIFPNGGPNRGSEGPTNLAIGCIKASILGVQSFWQFLTTQMTRVWQLRSTFQVDYVHLSRANHHEGTCIFNPTERRQKTLFREFHLSSHQSSRSLGHPKLIGWFTGVPILDCHFWIPFISTGWNNYSWFDSAINHTGFWSSQVSLPWLYNYFR